MSKPSKADRAKFYQQMGQCIAAWAFVEDHLFRICHAALGCTKPRAAIVYGHFRVVDMRLELTDELVRSVYPKKGSGGHDHPDVKEWKAVYLNIKSLMPTRNAIAHRPVAQIAPIRIPRKEVFGYLETLDVGELLFFSEQATESEMAILDHSREHLRDRTKKENLTSKDLSGHLSQVQTLYSRLNAVLLNVRKAQREMRPRLSKRTTHQ